MIKVWWDRSWLHKSNIPGVQALSPRNLFGVPQEDRQAASSVTLTKVFCYSKLISGKLDNLIGQLIRVFILRRGLRATTNNNLLDGLSSMPSRRKGEVKPPQVRSRNTVLVDFASCGWDLWKLLPSRAHLKRVKLPIRAHVDDDGTSFFGILLLLNATLTVRHIAGVNDPPPPSKRLNFVAWSMWWGTTVQLQKKLSWYFVHKTSRHLSGNTGIDPSWTNAELSKPLISVPIKQAATTPLRRQKGPFLHQHCH